jgi:hypothetical protein
MSVLGRNRCNSSGETSLGRVPIPSLEEIGSDSQFEPFEISQYKFERVWKKTIAKL